MKKVAILYSEYSPLVDAIKYQLSDYEVDCFTMLENLEKYDLIVQANFQGEFSGNSIKCHHSLLPSFNTKDPEKEAILAGVKVTGITVYYTNPEKIITQYPIFINSETHYDDLKRELSYLEQTIFPLIIKKILNNEWFEIQSLLNKGCGNFCGGCSQCNH